MGKRSAHASREEKEVHDNEVNDDSDDKEFDDSEDEVTRCICGKQHDTGMMVQCEDCFVWQHVVCMELDEKNLPDKYYCESCHPENHEQLFGRKRKASPLNDTKKVKKRTTLNSLISQIDEEIIPESQLTSRSRKPQRNSTEGKKRPASPVPSRSRSPSPSSSLSPSSSPTPLTTAPTSNVKQETPNHRTKLKKDPISPASEDASDNEPKEMLDVGKENINENEKNTKSEKIKSENEEKHSTKEKENSEKKENHKENSRENGKDHNNSKELFKEPKEPKEPKEKESEGEKPKSSRSSNSRSNGRISKFNKDMSLKDMLRRAKAMLDYLARSKQEMFIYTNKPIEELECFQYIHNLETKVVDFQNIFSIRLEANKK